MSTESEVKTIKTGIVPNPFRSRSTIAILACFGSVILIASMAMNTGFFNTEFAMMCLMAIREATGVALNHQRQTDQLQLQNGKAEGKVA